jgi:hypothetical protein
MVDCNEIGSQLSFKTMINPPALNKQFIKPLFLLCFLSLETAPDRVGIDKKHELNPQAAPETTA